MTYPYVYERQSEYWTSRQVEEYFLDEGFEVMTFPLTQYTERLIPADFIYFDKQRSKLFGFQYKALYHNGEDYWPIDSRQHTTLLNFPWIYYCLSELQPVQDPRAALHSVRIVETNAIGEQTKVFSTGEQSLRTYSRWLAFYQGLEKCYNGVKVESRSHLTKLLRPGNDIDTPRELAHLLVDLFLTDFSSRHTIHFSPMLRDYEISDSNDPDKPSPSSKNGDPYQALEIPRRSHSRAGYLKL